MKHTLVIPFLVLSVFVARGAGPDADTVKKLYDSADLVLLVTFPDKKDFGLWKVEGPIPVPGVDQIQFRETCPKIRVIKVLKGAPKTKGDFRVSIDLQQTVATPLFKPDVKQPYILFLEDRLKREPGSYQASGGKVVYYRLFDDKAGLMKADEAMLKVLQQAAVSRAEQQRKGVDLLTVDEVTVGHNPDGSPVKVKVIKGTTPAVPSGDAKDNSGN